MAIAHVQSPAGTFGSSTSRNITLSSPVAGNLVVIGGANFASGAARTVSSVTDNIGGNTWTSAIQLVFNTSNRIILYYSILVNVGATFTVTITWSGSCDNNIMASEYSGVASSPTLVTNSGTGNSTSPSSGSVSPSGNNLYYGLMGTDSTGTMTPHASWTQRHEQNEGNTGNGVPCNAEELLSSGSQTATWTLSSGNEWGAIVSTFDEAAVAGGQPIVKRYQGIPFMMQGHRQRHGVI